MANVFRLDDQHTEKPNRNVYDLTCVKNITTKFGQILPVYCKPVMNGESWSCEHMHQFNMLPLVFPIQTRVRASISYYYVRNRNLWNQWEDFQFKMKPNLVSPYIKFTKASKRHLLRVGGELDTLGVDVMVKGNIESKVGVELPDYRIREGKVYNPYLNTYDDYNGNVLYLEDSMFTVANGVKWMEYSSLGITSGNMTQTMRSLQYAPYYYPLVDETGMFALEDAVGEVYFLCRISKPDNVKYVVDRSVAGLSESDAGSRSNGSANDGRNRNTRQSTIASSRVSSTNVSQIEETDSLGESSKYVVISSTSGLPYLQAPSGYKIEEVLGVFFASGQGYMQGEAIVKINPKNFKFGYPLSDVSLKYLPYANEEFDDEKRLRLSALPLRAVESIYNAFIRNAENNPFKINGVPEYNKFLANTDGGADTYDYPTRYRNWQDDRFTTALHTPQHGDAPLVGLVNQVIADSGYVVTFANDDGTRNRVKFVKSSSTDNVLLKVADVDENFTNVPDVPSEGVVGQFKEAMVEAVKFGININDFRNVNSFQRWLENNVRKGYKYRDQIKSHYGVSVRYDTLDMPEYLGGTTRDMDCVQVTQTVENSEGVLGDYAGQAYIKGSSEHEITHYCDEEGFVIGLLSIMPTASYSQVIPKFWTRSSALDYYSPEFGKIGMQPILNREIAPVSSFYDGTGDKVFGYNRAWSDYLDETDSIHGKFRTEFGNFVLTRTFDGTPTLSEDFLVYDESQVNCPFYVDDGEDKILGQILFRVRSRLPIPLYGIAALE